MTDRLLAQEIGEEQEHVTAMYERLDVLRERARGELDRVQGEATVGNLQAYSERESFTQHFSGRVHQLSAVERGLCFGRIDETGGERFHIGRIGLFDEEYEALLVDWRTPLAQSFYRATPAAPLGVTRRRHIRLHGRTVVGVDDDVLDLDALGAADRSTLIGEAALLSSLGANRTGRMNEIVATIQTEQDEIIRAELPGVLVVQGGPGTGKTVVALHRAAYLLYTHRDQLARTGVLVVGPNPTFLRYIDQVLPSLGETDVVLATVGELYPGIAATAPESAEATRIKGDLAMAEVVERAVQGFQRVPEATIRFKVDQHELALRPSAVRKAKEKALDAGEPHNPARRVFVRRIITVLTNQIVDTIGRQYVGAEDVEDLRKELIEDDRVQAILDHLWPELTPQLLVSVLLSSPERLAAAAPHLTDAERAAIRRPIDAPWTPSDVPLLDEAAELIGELDADVAARRQQAAAAAAESADTWKYAREVVQVQLESENVVVMPWEIEQFAELVHRRTELIEKPVTVAERAASDRGWVFGHVIVDEAQELTAMDWRLLMRRCPRRSMTLVGDIAQTGSDAGVRSWAEVLDRYAPRRWRAAELTVNYRTPTEIMTVAAGVLTAIDPLLTAPTSVRAGNSAPWLRSTRSEDFTETLLAAIESERAAVGDGRIAVIAPASRTAALAAALPTVAESNDPAILEAPVALLDPSAAKGLEFDAVLIADPAGIIAESPRGLSDLYVAATRATKRLGVLADGVLPDVLIGGEQ
ncbi:DNA/RNA helicase domain-containing protein [Kribbella sandramycini]|uniref:DNA helicase IV n=1 Tax=Kribbella sandramycini TaxID=60450 RepID=A0A841SJ44_9ACTN|nr:DNA helicase IV [Kribbella sandramycini]